MTLQIKGSLEKSLPDYALHPLLNLVAKVHTVSGNSNNNFPPIGT